MSYRRGTTRRLCESFVPESDCLSGSHLILSSELGTGLLLLLALLLQALLLHLQLVSLLVEEGHGLHQLLLLSLGFLQLLLTG